MAEDLNQKLQKLHEAVVDSIAADVEALSQPMLDEDGNPVAVPLEQRQAVQRVALALLKQNGVTAPVAEGSRMDQASKLAGKLNFQGLAEKRPVVVPIRPGIEPSAS